MKRDIGLKFVFKRFSAKNCRILIFRAHTRSTLSLMFKGVLRGSKLNLRVYLIDSSEPAKFRKWYTRQEAKGEYKQIPKTVDFQLQWVQVVDITDIASGGQVQWCH